MKYLKFLLPVFLLATMTATAQVVSRKAKDSTANSATKYITFNSIPTGVVSFTASGLKVSGTVSGYAILQVATDTLPTVATRVFEDFTYPGTGKRDTLFFTDLATVQTHTFPVGDGKAPVNAARFKVVTSGTQKLYLYALSLQR